MNMKAKKMLQWINRYKNSIFSLLIVIAFPLVYLLVYYTGGIKYVYSHTMYIPILLAGVFFGVKYGLLAGIVGGLLLGPMMPLVVETGESQDLVNWLYRLVIFSAIGGLSGYFADQFKKTIKLNKKLFCEHPDTGNPNINHLLQMDEQYIDHQVTVASIIINNKNNISEVLGADLFLDLMHQLYQLIRSHLPEKSVVIQSDSDKFWIIFKLNQIDVDARKIFGNLSNQIDIKGIKVYIDYSIGVSQASSFKQCQSLVPFRDTDRLAAYAKANNLPYVVYNQDILKKKYQFDLLGLFPSALQNNDTYLVYHPILDVKTMEVVGLEALLRWQDERHGLVMPNDFIPLIESTQLIHPMTQWVFEEAIHFQKRVEEKGFKTLMTINLSSKNLSNPSFYDSIVETQDGLEAISEDIMFEITESILLNQDNSTTQDNIIKLRKAGFKIAIDDFGKGYSSLTYLSHFKTEILKIDKRYIQDMVDNDSIYEIVKATVNLAHRFDIKVVAEGVETKKTLQALKDVGIDYVQGFYITKPMKEEETLKWLKDQGKKDSES